MSPLGVFNIYFFTIKKKTNAVAMELAQYLVIGFGLVFISSIAAVVLGKRCPRVHLYTEEECFEIARGVATDVYYHRENYVTDFTIREFNELVKSTPLPTASEARELRKRKEFIKEKALAIIKEQENNRSANNANSLPRNQEGLFPTCNDSELPNVQPCS
jgi:hypothetical protein